MATQKSRQQIINEHNGPTMIGVFDGHFDYPSSRGLGVDVVDYLRRNPHPQEHNPLPVKTKMRDLPHLIVRDLEDAAAKGELREELGRHIGLLEKMGTRTKALSGCCAITSASLLGTRPATVIS